MKRLVFALLGCLGIGLAVPVDSRAQGSFAGTGLRPGQIVRVTDSRTGERFKGSVESFAADVIRVDNRDFTPRAVSRIERQGDSLWNGVIVGAVLGAAWSLTPNEACLHKSRAQCVGIGAETGLLVGTMIDWLHEGYTTVYPQLTQTRSIRLAPQWGRRIRGIAFAIGF